MRMPSFGIFSMISPRIVMLLPRIRIPMLPAGNAVPLSLTPAPVASIESPTPVMIGSTVVRLILAGEADGKIAGSKMIVFAAPSALASSMACRSVPAPLFAAPIVYCAPRDRSVR